MGFLGYAWACPLCKFNVACTQKYVVEASQTTHIRMHVDQHMRDLDEEHRKVYDSHNNLDVWINKGFKPTHTRDDQWDV